jgi:hypothetical protein
MKRNSFSYDNNNKPIEIDKKERKRAKSFNIKLNQSLKLLEFNFS